MAICPLGVFACDEGGRIVDKQLFDANFRSASTKFLSMRQGKLIPELKSLYERVHKKSSEITLEGEKNFGLDVVTQFPNPCGIFLRKNLASLAKENNFHQFGQFVHNLSLELADEKLSADLKKPDKLVIQMVNALNEVNENVNVLSARMDEINLLKLDQKNQAMAKEFGSAVSTLRNSQRLLEYEIGRLMKENFPNIAVVAGAIIGAKLISIAGDVDRLSKMASSKIQVLGAEKALFRHLTTGAKPPKYGIISTHPVFSSVPPHLGGRVARMFASKISIASKADVYTKHFIGDELKKELEEEIRKLKKWTDRK